MAESLVGLRDRRAEVIAQLSDAYANDLFDVDELDRRLALAQAARTVAELEMLAEDLGTALAIAEPQGLAVKKQRVIMSSIERRGRWTVPARMELRVVWGRVELDLREAVLAPGLTTIDIRIAMGRLELIVPPELAIDVEVSSMMGRVDERHREPIEHDAAKPTLRITGSVVMGRVEITTLLRGETKREGRWRVREARWDRRRERRRARKLGRRAGYELPPGGRSDM